MERTQIALFGKKDDKQLLALAKAVDAEGGTPRLLDIGLWESGAPLCCSALSTLPGATADLDGVESVYIRGTAPNTLPAPAADAECRAVLRNARTRYIREQEYQAFTYSFFDLLAARGKLVVNRLGTYVHHNAKAQFYERMRAHAIPFPGH